MPLYSVTTEAGALSGEAKFKLAGNLTTLHSEYSGVPKNWVHVVFHDYAPGSGFTAGEASATAALTVLIRTGRSSDYKRALSKRLWELFQKQRARRTTRSSSAFRKCRPAKPWRWRRSCQTSPTRDRAIRLIHAEEHCVPGELAMNCINSLQSRYWRRACHSALRPELSRARGQAMPESRSPA